MPRAPVFCSYLAVAATASLSLACSVASKVEFTDCQVSADCRDAFGVGWACGDTGLCEEQPAPQRCTEVWPKDLFTNSDKYRDAIILGSLFDHIADSYLLNAANLAVEHANMSGLADGRLYGVVHCDFREDVELDSQSSEEAALAGAKYLVEQLGTPAILGPSTSGLSEAVFSELQKPTYPPTLLISPSATSSSLTDIDVRTGDAPGLFWRTAPPDSILGRSLAERMLSEGITSATVFFENNSYGQGLAGELAKNFAPAPDLIAFETSSQIPDLLGEFTAANTSSNTTAVVFIASEQAQVSEFLNSAGSFPYFNAPDEVEERVRIYLSDAGYTTSVLNDTSNTMAPKLYPQIRGVFPGEPSGSIYNLFVAAYNSLFKDDATKDSYSAHSYDAAWLAIYGSAWAFYQRGGELTGENFARGLQRISDPNGRQVDVSRTTWNAVKAEFQAGRSIDIRGASGELDYDAVTEETSASVIYWRINDAGTGFEVLP